MLARLSLLCALLPGACAAAAPFPRGDGLAESHSSEGYWLARADEAESRGAADEALLCLERWERDYPERADRALHQRRLRLARELADTPTLLAAQQALLAGAPEDVELRFSLAEDLARAGQLDAALALLAGIDADPAARVRAWRRSAEYLEQAGDCLAAAAMMERAAADPGAGEAAPAWWERASWLWERGGDRARATRAIEQALAGLALNPREDAALGRLRAFELGLIANVEDACAVLRFHGDPELRCTAVRHLAARRFPDEISVFGRALADPDERVVEIALAQLGARVTASERDYVAACARGLIADPRASVRRAALALLGASGGASDLPLLLEALDPADRAQFRIALRALESVSGQTLPSPPDPDLEERERLRAAWLEWWKERNARQ